MNRCLRIAVASLEEGKKKGKKKKENIPRTNDIDPITDVERIRS